MPFANQLSHPALRADETTWRPRVSLVADHAAFAGGSKPATPPRSFAAGVGRILAAVLDGFAAAGKAMHPSFAPARETDPTAQEGAPPAASLRGLWSEMSRNWQDRRTRAAWEVLDDRTLRDIGISRYEIESFARFRPAGRHHDPRR
jgi:uncharacterized protein YjiS (DUF1127 family)